MKYLFLLGVAAFKFTRCLLIAALVVGLGVLVYHKNFSQDAYEKHIQDIYQKLKVHTGVPDYLPALSIKDSPEVNAWISAKGAVITTGMLQHLENEDQIATILGHEIAHYVLGHLDGHQFEDNRINEANADRYGFYLMMRSGYDVCESQKVWKMMLRNFGEKVLTTTHPNYTGRLYSAQFPHC